MTCSRPGSKTKSTHRHTSELEGRCSAFTRSGIQCSRRAKCFLRGYLPSCLQHEFYSQQAGNCQAIETCGNPCLRLALYDPPFHFCDEHKYGTNTLPCYILGLPTELRLIIFRYLFPAFVPEKRPGGNTWRVIGLYQSILKVNRQIYEEASSVLYGEIPFHVFIESWQIHFCGLEWTRDWRYPACRKGMGLLLEKTLPAIVAKRVQKFQIKVALGESSEYSMAYLPLSPEEHGLFEVRDSVRKFVELIRRRPSDPVRSIQQAETAAYQSLVVIPTVGSAYPWELDEVIAAIILVVEPFRMLHLIKAPTLSQSKVRLRPNKEPITIGFLKNEGRNSKIKDKLYRRYQKKWQLSLQADFPPASASDRGWTGRRKAQEEIANARFKRVEEFVSLLYAMDREHSEESKVCVPWTTGTFKYLVEPLHLARFACENLNPAIIAKVQDAFKTRWINHQRRLQSGAQPIADAINNMWEPGSGERPPREQFPDAFQFANEEPLETEELLRAWDDLDFDERHRVPDRKAPGVDFDEDSEREYFCVGGVETVRLKTPATVRAARSAKDG